MNILNALRKLRTGNTTAATRTVCQQIGLQLHGKETVCNNWSCIHNKLVFLHLQFVGCFLPR